MITLVMSFVLVGQFHQDLQTIVIPTFETVGNCAESAMQIKNQLINTTSVQIKDIKSSCLNSGTVIIK